MAEVKNCKKCNRIFSADDNAIFCKKCEAEEEEIFKEIRDYLYENPGTSIHDLSVRFNVSINRIERYIRNGRFEVL